VLDVFAASAELSLGNFVIPVCGTDGAGRAFNRIDSGTVVNLY